MKNIQVQGSTTILEIYNGHLRTSNTHNEQRNKFSLEHPITDSVIIMVLISTASLLCKF